MEYQAINATEATEANPHVTIERAALYPALDLIARKLVERRNTIPILSNVMIEATADGKMRLTGTDLDIEIQVTLPAQWEVPGRFTVSAQTLRDIVSKAAPGAEIRLQINADARLVVTSGRIKQTLPTLPCDDFPRAELDAGFTFEAPESFAADLATVAPFAEKTGHKYYFLQGVAMAALGNTLNFVATDGHTMARVAYPLPTGLERDEPAIIPNKAIALVRLLDKLSGNVTPFVGISARHIAFEYGDIVLTSKLIDGTFPTNWAEFITPTGEISGLMLPELDARFPSGRVESLGKAVTGPLQWETGEYGEVTVAFISCPSMPHWNAVLCGTKTPVYPQGYDTDAGVTVEADGVIYPVAVKSGRIHLSAETVAALCGPVDPSTHVYIPTHTYYRGKCVAIDGVPTDDMPAGYKVNPIMPKGKARYDVIIKIGTIITTPGMTKREKIDAAFDAQIETLKAQEAAPETQADDAPATTLAETSEIEPSAPEIGLADSVEVQPDHVAALLARMDALENGLREVSASGFLNNEPCVKPIHPFVGIWDGAPLSGKPKRTAAHVRAIMAYLAMRKQRNGALFMVRLRTDTLENANRSIQYWRDLNDAESRRANEASRKRRRAVMKARDLQTRLYAEYKLVDKANERARDNECKAITAETCARAAEGREAALKTELATIKQRMADPTNPARESDLLLLKGNAEKWQAKANAAIEESDRLRRSVLQSAGSIEALASRLARAEAILRNQGTPSAVRLTAVAS